VGRDFSLYRMAGRTWQLGWWRSIAVLSVRQNAAAQAPAAPTGRASLAAPITSKDTESAQIEELRQLAGLKDKGILTEEEFVAKKTQVAGDLIRSTRYLDPRC
jgi:Short C-terminal domain